MPVYRPACEDAYLSLVFSEGVFITESTAARRWEHGFSPDARGLAHGPMPWRPSGCPSAGAHGGRTAARVCPTRPPNRGGTCAGGAAGPCRPARLDCDRFRPSVWGPSAQIAFSPLGTPEDSTRRSAPEYRAPERSSVVGAGHGCQPSAEAPPDISHHSKGDPQDQRRAERQVGRGPERGRCHRAAELMNEQGNSRPQNSSDQYVAGIVHPKVHPA